MIFLLVLLVLIVALYLFHRQPNAPPRRLGVYSERGKYYPLKYTLIRLLLFIRKWRQNNKQSDDLITRGQRRSVEELERKHQLPEGEYAADAIYFNASNRNGWWINLGMAQRQHQIINLFFILHVPGMGTLINEELATTSNVGSLPSDDCYVTRSGFTARCVHPMQEWNIRFVGKLLDGDGKVKQTAIDASFDLTWTAEGDHFDFDVDISPSLLSESLGIEPWSREMFNRLRTSHQSHYEQFGRLKGIIQIGTTNTHRVEMISMRDHTLAKFRRWSQIRRYIMIIYHLEDGTRIHTSIISMPEVVFSHLKFGYVISAAGNKIPVDAIDLHLADIGEDKDFPTAFSYSFSAGNQLYQVDVMVKHSVRFKMGLDLQCCVQENLCEFIVNGSLKGYGFAEVEYRIEPY